MRDKEAHERIIRESKQRFKKIYEELEIRLDELEGGKKRQYTIIAGLISFILGSILCYVFQGIWGYEKTVSEVAYSIIFGVLTGIVVSLCVYIKFDLEESSLRREMLEYKAEDIQKEVQDDLFENSIKMSYKYLDQYYLQTSTIQFN